MVNQYRYMNYIYVITMKFSVNYLFIENTYFFKTRNIHYLFYRLIFFTFILLLIINKE